MQRVRAASGVRDGVTGSVSVRGATTFLLRFLQQWIKPNFGSFLSAFFLEFCIFFVDSLFTSVFITYIYFLLRAGIAQSVQQLATGWITEGSEFESQ